ncbi:MAG: hypothetical protein Q9220_005963 [cf. Caloplaca sp. 1 TL-2023]
MVAVSKDTSTLAPNESMVDILLSNGSSDPLGTANRGLKSRQAVLVRALDLLHWIHDDDQELSGALDELEPSFEKRQQRIVDSLLDFIVIEGIYPSLSPGVGVPIQNRLKSALAGNLITRPANEYHGPGTDAEELLIVILDRLLPLAHQKEGIALSIRERIFVDLIAATGELSFCPTIGEQSHEKYSQSLRRLIDSTRKYGAPGTIGWKLFAEPIIEYFNPAGEDCHVSEESLYLAITRLSALTCLNANPGLVKRLVGPILLPLWGLQCYAIEHQKSRWADRVLQILNSYAKVAVTESQLILWSQHLLWNGTDDWTFMPGGNGGIEIRARAENRAQPIDIATIIPTIESRVTTYLGLLSSAVLTDAQLSNIFTQASKTWLLGSQGDTKNSALNIVDDSTTEPIQSLANAKLVQKLLEDFQGQIASSLYNVLQLLEPIFSAFVTKHRESIDREIKRSKPSLSGLHSIAKSDEGGEGDNAVDETISTALSLLSAVLTTSSTTTMNECSSLLEAIRSSLIYITSNKSLLDPSLATTASNTLMLLDLQSYSSSAMQGVETTKAVNPLADDQNRQRKALIHLSDELAPVRAQGLAAMTDLIQRASPVLSVPSTVLLLVSLLQDEDEYIYLSAIKALGLLTSNHPKTVIKMLVEQYVDQTEESSLDVRIKVGEALNKTIENLGQAFVGAIATKVGKSMIAVASRRGDRPKTMQKRDRAKRKAQKARKEADEAWDGEVPEESADEDEEPQMNEHIAKTLEGWADTGREEDIRIRTSALSILGTAIETNIAGIGATITSTAIDCVLSILKLEKGAERAILRRAAVMVIMSLIRALDSAHEQGQELGFGFAGENLAEVITVLRYVEFTDGDETVVGHVRSVIEGLEIWQQKSVFGISRLEENRNIRMTLDGNKIAGLSVRPKIQEID